jgi:hypothetical protein
MMLTGLEAVGVYTNFLALFMLMGLITLSKRIVEGREDEDRLFLMMAIPVIIRALVGILYHLSIIFSKDNVVWIRTLCITVGRIGVLVLLCLWILYVDYKCNHSRDHLVRTYSAMWIPFTILVFLLILNLPFGIVFKVGADGNVSFGWLFYMFMLADVIFFGISGLLLHRYRASSGLMRFFRLRPIMIPVLVGVMGEVNLFFTTEALGFCVGLIFLYFSMAGGWRYEDEDPFFFNHAYLARVRRQIIKGTSDIKAAILITVGKNREGAVKVLKAELPTDSEVIQLSEDRYLFLSSNNNKKLLKRMKEMLETAGAYYDEYHTGEKTDIKCESMLLHGEEEISGWLKEYGGV